MMEKKRSSRERDVINNVRVFAQLQTPEDHDKFVDGLLKEMQLRDKIAELQEFRENGLTALAAGQDYLRDKANKVCFFGANLQGSISTVSNQKLLPSFSAYESTTYHF